MRDTSIIKCSSRKRKNRVIEELVPACPSTRWYKVKFAEECDPCPDCGEPFCIECGIHYADCKCIGPTEDDVEYKMRGHTLWGRRKKEMIT